MKIDCENSGHKSRLRNRFVNEGLENFEPHEVLEVMLYKSFPYKDTNGLAHKLIDRFGSFAAVVEAPFAELEKVEGMGRNSAITLSMWREFFRYYERSKKFVPGKIYSPESLGELATAMLKASVSEELHVVCLDVQNRLLGSVKISQNSPTFVAATVREIIERSFRFNSAAIAMFHSHPTGLPEPSNEDVRFTANLLASCRQMGILLIDHIIVADDRTYSFRTTGTLNALNDKITRMQESIALLNF